MEQCKTLVLGWFAPRLEGLTLEDTVKDNKTRLQELLQSHKLPLPVYNILNVDGASHSQHFVVECVVDEANLACRGEGHSRRLAEQMAAGLMLDALENSGTGS
jgi:ribonuclease-3